MHLGRRWVMILELHAGNCNCLFLILELHLGRIWVVLYATRIALDENGMVLWYIQFFSCNWSGRWIVILGCCGIELLIAAFLCPCFGGLSLTNAVAFEKNAPEGSLVNVDVGIARIQTRIAKPILGINWCEFCFWGHVQQFWGKWVVSEVQMVDTNNSGSRWYIFCQHFLNSKPYSEQVCEGLKIWM